MIEIALLLATGVVTGFLNTVAGGGSFLSIPVLIFLGLPPGVANGTNRIAIVAQNLSGVWGFHRHGKVPWAWAARAVLPTCLGTLVGTWLALETPDADFKRWLAFFMVAITLWTLWQGGVEAARESGRASPPANELAVGGKGWWVAFGLFVAGLYGGFLQAGVGFLVLAVTSYAGLDLVRGNAVKVVIILVSTVISIPAFLVAGKLAWIPGLVLALGTIVGAHWGVRMAVLKGQRWLRWVVAIAVVLCALKLWLSAG